jgi:hypothetical protein
MAGTKVDDLVRYLGYARAVAIDKGMGAGKTCSMLGDGNERYVPEHMNRVRALIAEQYRSAGLQPPEHSCFKGLSPLLSPDLYWVDANRLWVVPFCHAFFLGVFKDFMEAIFAKGAAAQVSSSISCACSLQFPSVATLSTECVGHNLMRSSNRWFLRQAIVVSVSGNSCVCECCSFYSK